MKRQDDDYYGKSPADLEMWVIGILWFGMWIALFIGALYLLVQLVHWFW